MKNFLMTSNKGLNKGGKGASHVVPTDFGSQVALIAGSMPAYKKALLVLNRRLTFDEK